MTARTVPEGENAVSDRLLLTLDERLQPPASLEAGRYPVRSRTLTEPSAVIGGRAAFVLAGILEGSLRGRLSLRALLADIGVGERDQEVALEAEQALREAGDLWRQAFPQSGNAATRGNDGPADFAAVKPPRSFLTSTEAAVVSGYTARRLRQLAAAGDVPAERTSNGCWAFAHGDVVGLRDQREARL